MFLLTIFLQSKSSSPKISSNKNRSLIIYKAAGHYNVGKSHCPIFKESYYEYAFDENTEAG